MAADGEAAAEDRREGHCRRLGHPVSFSYCRRAGDGLPCPRILDCWFETFDVASFLRSAYSPEELGRAFRPQPPKVTQLLEILQAARRGAASAGSTPEDPHEPR